MALYNFTLTLSGVTAQTDGLEDALFKAGCDDGLICFYGQSVYIEFDREAASFDLAIESAIANIESSAIGARVESIDSALVGLSDIAQLTGLTRQAIALLKDGARGQGDFPCPIQRITGQSPLWDWGMVAEWLGANDRLSKYPQLVENAKILCKWNLVLRNSASENLEELQSLTNKLYLQRKKKQPTEVSC